MSASSEEPYNSLPARQLLVSSLAGEDANESYPEKLEACLK